MESAPIELESEPKKGTTFIVELPLEVPQVKPASKDDAA